MFRLGLLGLVIYAVALLSPAHSRTFSYAFQGSLNSLDPHALNETFTLGTLSNVYEGLIVRDEKLRIRPGLAARWETISPTHWRFHLRRGVRFHNGNTFDADDVLFSVNRVRRAGSKLKSRIPPNARFEKVDSHTVDVHLARPNPILIAEWEHWFIMDREWTMAREGEHGDAVQSKSTEAKASAVAHVANGTGPFRVISHDGDVKTVFEVNTDWWGEARHNLHTVEFMPIKTAATRVAALLSGAVDMIYPVPVQDIARIKSNAGTTVVTGPELRTIFLGMDQWRDELVDSDVAGRNPFKDVRVRRAFHHAIDKAAIRDVVMRGHAKPTRQIISDVLFKPDAPLPAYDYDPERARALLAEAGLADGFEVTMDCPNDRYVNDEAICVAVAGFLAKVGVHVTVNAQPKSIYFKKILARGGYDTSFYLLGYTPGSLDAWNVLHKLHGCRDSKAGRGPFNIGGYCNRELDSLSDRILGEPDLIRRDRLIEDALRMVGVDAAYIPIHQQVLSWGVRRGVRVRQRADNVFRFDLVYKQHQDASR